VIVVEEIGAEAGQRLARPVRRAAGIVVVANPFPGRSVDDLSARFDLGAEAGGFLMKRTSADGGRPRPRSGKARVA
jgi:hypothetical protein